MGSNIPITNGQGQSSVAAEEIGSLKYQQIKVIGGEVGSTSVWGINPDRSAQVSVVGIVNVAGSVFATLSGAGSIIAVPTGNQSVSGTVGASVIGWIPIQASNTSIISYIQNSIAAVIIGGSIAATITPAANQSVSGTVGASVIGWVPIQPSNTSTIGIFQNSSILAVPVGSVITVLQSSSILAVPVGSVITVWQNSSVLAVPVGSIIGVWQNASIAGTYAEDAAHTTGDKGLFALGVRNDTQTSITSADGDYSPLAVGPTGAIIATDAPITKWIQGTADLRVVLGSSVTAIAAQGASIFTYIREIQVANMGSASVLVTFGGGLGSILGYTIAPAGGGSNFITRLKTGENSAFTASISGTASVLVSAQGFTAKI